MRDFPQPLALHGAFIDLALHSPDLEIAAVSKRRILSDLEIASELGCKGVILHTGFNPHVLVPQYQEEFFHGHRDFWRDALRQHPNLTVCLENTYEREPATQLLESRRTRRPALALNFQEAGQAARVGER